MKIFLFLNLYNCGIFIDRRKMFRLTIYVFEKKRSLYVGIFTCMQNFLSGFIDFKVLQNDPVFLISNQILRQSILKVWSNFNVFVQRQKSAKISKLTKNGLYAWKFILCKDSRSDSSFCEWILYMKVYYAHEFYALRFILCMDYMPVYSVNGLFTSSFSAWILCVKFHSMHGFYAWEFILYIDSMN